MGVDFDLTHLYEEVSNFQAGNIANYLPAWKCLTSDANIVDIVREGLKLNFLSQPPLGGEPFSYPRHQADYVIIDAEVKKLQTKGVIKPSIREEGEYFSNLFTTPKKDGTYRTILNLKSLNKDFCGTAHFKMESLKHALHIVRQGSFLASIDIKDAFYSVPIHEDHRKYLKFMWDGNIFQFCAMPNGYCDAMRVFTKLLKPVFASLREQGYDSIIYVDDSFLLGDSYDECLANIRITLQTLRSLGFVIHPDKSILRPTQELVFLGFIINSVHMTVELTYEKKMKIKNMGIGLLSSEKISVRMVSSFIGNLTASFEAVPAGRLYYRHLEWCKNLALEESGYDFEAQCFLSEQGKVEISWWINNIESAFAYIQDTPEIDRTIFTDASKHLGGGWGASDINFGEINGRWSLEEQEMNINCLELKAILLALLSFVPLYDECKHIRVMSDNTSAIAYINKKGGTHCMTLNDLAVQIWEYCMDNDIYISAAHIPGKHNILADIASREFHDSAEWSISPEIFSRLVTKFGLPDIDLFASRLNHQLPVYASWQPDPESSHIDAMSFSWRNLFIYAFPPFSMVWPVISKMRRDGVKRAVLVIPEWPTQSWYPRLQKLRLPEGCLRISNSKLFLPGTTDRHPMGKRLRLMAVVCSGCPE